MGLMYEADGPLLPSGFQATLGQQCTGQFVGIAEGVETSSARYRGKVARCQICLGAQAAGGVMLWILKCQSLEVFSK